MKKIDLYIIRKFLGTFFFILILLVVISVVIDITEKIDVFMRSDATLYEIVTVYFATFIPHIATLLGPYFVLVAVVFFTSTLAYRTEIVAMISGGINFYRLFVPYFVSATILAMLLFLLNNYWIPDLNKIRIKFENEELTTWKRKYETSIHRKIDDNTFLYLSNFHLIDSVGNRVSLESYKGNKLQKKVLADKMVWNSENQNWKLKKYLIREFHDDGEIMYRGEEMDTIINIRPDEFDEEIYFKDQMTTPELKEYIIKLKEAGIDGIDYYELERHRRISSVFSIYILTLIGFSLASRKRRGGMGVHLVGAIIIGALFEVSMKFSTTFTTNADLSPFMGVWIPNFIFIAVALVLVRLAQK